MLNIRKDVKLSNLSRIGIGGIAKYYTEIKSIEEFKDLAKYAKEKDLQFIIIGDGTNILFNNNILDKVIVKISNFDIKIDNTKNTVIYADAGVKMNKLVEYSLSNNLSGLEWAGGLPGTLGGAIFGNAGAFGGEIKDIVSEVSGVTVSKNSIKKFSFNKKDCLFGYRNSIFKETNIDRKSKKFNIIFGAKIKLSKSKNIDDEKRIFDDVIKYRHRHHPIRSKTLGSTFANIPVSSIKKSVVKNFEKNIKIDPIPLIPVAVILHKLGLSGYKIGGAEFSSKHLNFIINKNGATFKDVEDLINTAKQMAFSQFGIELREEIRIIK